MSNSYTELQKDFSASLSERDQRGNIIRLTLAQALAGANSVGIYAVGAIIGHTLAEHKVLATLPISIFVVGMAVCILPAGTIARRHGRKIAFLSGAGCGMMAGLLGAIAIVLGSFWLFCLATFFGGAYAAVVLSFRFAAADGVDPGSRARALSFVMSGGVAAGVIGPQLVTYTMYLWPEYTFSATFVVQIIVAALSGIVLLGVRLPMPSAVEMVDRRPLRAIMCQPLFIIAIVCGMVSYLLMNFLMTAAPLAMQMCGHSQESANLGLQWHVIAMYAPSFFTGRLIARLGAGRVVVVGLLLIGLSIVVGLTGADVTHFWFTLILLGAGWNFGFIGASTLVLECHRAEERTYVQSLSDFIVFGTIAVGSFASGGLLSVYDWDTVLWVSFVPLILAVVILALAGRNLLTTEPVR